jgi:hypothetical protein
MLSASISAFAEDSQSGGAVAQLKSAGSANDDDVWRPSKWGEDHKADKQLYI